MDWIWWLAAIFCVWSVLRVIGAERQRRLHELILQIAIQQAEEPRKPYKPSAPTPPAPPAAAAAAAAPPVRSKPAR